MSEEEIRKGEYVRTKKGNIGKVLDITTCTGQKRKKYLIKWNIVKAYYITGTTIVKHSPNIIDLIEVGDLIKYDSNSCGVDVIGEVIEVCKVYEDYDKGEGFVSTMLDDFIRSNNIKSIVTEEQFSEMEYKV